MPNVSYEFEIILFASFAIVGRSKKLFTPRYLRPCVWSPTPITQHICYQFLGELNHSNRIICTTNTTKHGEDTQIEENERNPFAPRKAGCEKIIAENVTPITIFPIYPLT